VDKAIGQLSDEEVAKLADRSRRAEERFCGRSYLRAKTLAYIILAVVVIG